MKKRLPNFILHSAFFFIFFLALIPILKIKALSIDELRQKIDEKNQAIKDLETQIVEQQKQIDEVGKQASSLKNTLKLLDAERKKFLAQIKVTENKITSASFLIESLSSSILGKEKNIGENSLAVAQILKQINELDSNSIVEATLNYNKLSDMWSSIDQLEQLSIKITQKVSSLKEAKKSLEKDKMESEQKKQELLALKTELADRKKIVEINQTEKNKLLKETQNKESNYKKILEEKFAMRDSFEREVLDFEAQLKFEIDPKNLPTPSSGILKWPLDFVKITQYFGKTDFANAHPQLYNGAGHNGIDLRASIGTVVKSSLRGKVIGTGNTDTVCPGASYGKWVLIEHPNGLSTLYAHLSLIKVESGQQISTGEMIGYSGNTGYATGPHLHFTVYASQGVEIMSRKSKVCNGTYTMPFADFRAYLNPLSYL